MKRLARKTVYHSAAMLISLIAANLDAEPCQVTTVTPLHTLSHRIKTSLLWHQHPLHFESAPSKLSREAMRIIEQRTIRHETEIMR